MPAPAGEHGRLLVRDVPLSPATLALLAALPRMADTDFVFPAPRVAR